MQDSIAIIRTVLTAAGWRNQTTAIAEALPHLVEELGYFDVLAVLENLNVPYKRVTCRENQLTDNECPAFIFPNSGAWYGCLTVKGKLISSHCSERNEVVEFESTRKKCLVVRVERCRAELRTSEEVSVDTAFGLWRSYFPWLVITSLLLSLIGLISPLLIMIVYDRVIPANSTELLFSLLIGVTVLLGSDLLIRHLRTRALAYIGQRGEKVLARALFQKLVSLPLKQLEKSDLEQQLSRFRQFESLRDIFTGQVLTTLLDLPFSITFLIALLFLAPNVGALILCTYLAFALLFLLTQQRAQELEVEANSTNVALKSIYSDAIEHHSAISGLGLDDAWRKRALPLIEASQTAMQSFKRHQSSIQLFGQTLIAISVSGAIVLGTVSALSGGISFGVLIAVIAMVPKALSPVQSFVGVLPQISGFLRSKHQANRVLALTSELEIGLSQSHQKDLSGEIRFNGVTYRPDPLANPLLSQVSFSVAPRETVMVMGSDVPSRVALLELIQGLYEPLSGTIEHDGVDIRQIARDDLRELVSYMPERPEVFFGTVDQNFKLANPLLSTSSVNLALGRMGLTDRHNLKADTRLSDAGTLSMPTNVAKTLSIARCLVRQSSIFLFAEPTTGLSDASRDDFKNWLSAVRGESTILFSSSDRSLMYYADRYLFLENGRLVVNDLGDIGLKKAIAQATNRG